MIPLQTLLFATDGSACAERARPAALALADRYGAALHVLRVVPEPEGDGAADGAVPTAPVPAASGARVVEVARWGVEAGHEILAYAADTGADLIVMGTHGRSGFDRLVLGSMAEYVLRRAACPVLLVPQDGAPDLDGDVLVADDFSDTAARALHLGRQFAADAGVGLDVLHVVPLVNLFGLSEGFVYPAVDYPALLHEASASLRARVLEDAAATPLTERDATIRATIGDAAEEIVGHAQRGRIGLIVMGSHGRRGLGRALLGSVAELVVRHAPCPVLVVREAGHPATRPAPHAAEALLLPALVG